MHEKKRHLQMQKEKHRQLVCLFPRAMRKIAMFAWLFDECREGRCPLGANNPLPCSEAILIPRCLQRGF